MATNRTRRTRAISHKVIPLDESVKNVLLYGKAERGTPGHLLRVSRFFDGGQAIREAWTDHKGALLPLWKGPGRPWAEG